MWHLTEDQERRLLRLGPLQQVAVIQRCGLAGERQDYRAIARLVGRAQPAVSRAYRRAHQELSLPGTLTLSGPVPSTSEAWREQLQHCLRQVYQENARAALVRAEQRVASEQQASTERLNVLLWVGIQQAAQAGEQVLVPVAWLVRLLDATPASWEAGDPPGSEST